MDYKPRNMRPFLLGPDCYRLVAEVTARKLGIMRSLVGKESRDTQRSGRMTIDQGGKGDRHRGVITFGENALAEQFGNKRRPASRFMTRAMEID